MEQDLNALNKQAIAISKKYMGGLAWPTVIHSGRQIATAEARVEDEKGQLYAHATTTCFVFDVPTD